MIETTNSKGNEDQKELQNAGGEAGKQYLIIKREMTTQEKEKNRNNEFQE